MKQSGTISKARKVAVAPLLAAWLSWLPAILAPVAAVAEEADALQRGGEIFQRHCAACHGPEGRPDPDSGVVRGLGVTPANFSDPLFNSREPAEDWELVVTHGGQALAFSARMPAFEDVLSEADIEAVVAYAKTLGGAHDYPDGSLNLFLPLRTKKAFPEDEWVWKQRYSDRDGDRVWENVLEYEFRIGERSQGVIEVTHATQSGHAEFGHFEPGFKHVLAHDRHAGFIATVGGNVGIPLNGEAEWELLPYLAFGKVLNGSFTLQGSGRLKLSLEDSDESSAEFAGIVHWTHTAWPRNVFPALEVAAEVPFERGDSPDRVDAVQLSMIPQVRIGLNRRGHVALNLGMEFPLNEKDRYDWRAHVFLIWDFADGGFFEGW